jgi:hypothetical protein
MKLLHAIPLLCSPSVFPVTLELLGGSEPPYETLNPNPESRAPDPELIERHSVRVTVDVR